MMEAPVAAWLERMERHLKLLQGQQDHDLMRETLRELQKHISAWQTLYEPPPPEPPRPLSMDPLMGGGRRGFSERTIAST